MSNLHADPDIDIDVVATVEFTAYELRWLRSQIRMMYRKTLRNKAKSQAQWSEEYDDRHDQKLAFLISLYQKLVPGTTGASFLQEVLHDTES